MDETGRKLEKPEMLPSGENRYVLFDHSRSCVTAFCPKAQGHLENFEYIKRMAVDALERARAGGAKTGSIVVQTLGDGALSEIPDQDHDDVKSDAESLHQHRGDALTDDENCVDDELNEDRVRRKLKVLAEMVGVDSAKPGAVLDEVVKVLRDLERRNASLP